jgi:DNA-binding NarL/FixJ family response regulator
MPKSTRVLIVDDDYSFREALAYLIADLPGVELAGEARNGEEMLALAAALQPDVVITDINMPVLDGIAATQQLKAQPSPPRVLICSCDSSVQLRCAATAAGADAFIPKREACARLTALLVPRPTQSGSVLPLPLAGEGESRIRAPTLS